MSLDSYEYLEDSKIWAKTQNPIEKRKRGLVQYLQCRVFALKVSS